MKKLFFLLLILNTSCFAQQFWEDNFWVDKVSQKCKETGSAYGYYEERYNNGGLKWKGRCDSLGNPDSVWIYYDKRGFRLWEGYYNGPYTEYYESSAIYITGYYSNGKISGEWRSFESAGKIYREGSYINGVPTGEWNFYDSYEYYDPDGTYIHGGKNYKTKTVNLITKNIRYYSPFGELLKTVIDSTVEVDPNEIYHISHSHENLNDTTEYDHTRIEAMAGIKQISLNRLNNELFKHNENFSNNLLYYGLCIQTTTTNETNILSEVKMYYIQNQSISYINPTKSSLSGWGVTLNFGFDLFKKNKVIDLIPSLGFGYDRLSLKMRSDTSYSNNLYFDQKKMAFKNPSLNINGRIQLRFDIKRFTLSAIGGYVQDLSYQKWYNHFTYLKNSPRTNQSGPFIEARIGFLVP